MFPPKEKFLDDMARLAGGTVTAMTSLSQQLREEIRVRVNEMGTRLDFVPREDFERMEALLIQTRVEQENLSKRLSALEEKNSATKKPPAKKQTTKSKSE